jgi:hypothetical protein
VEASGGSLGVCTSSVFVWALTLAGCRVDDDRESTRRIIGPEGGVIASSDDVLRIAILPGALSQAIDVVIEPSDDPPPIFGPAYRVRPDIDLAIEAEITYRRVLATHPEGVAVAAIRRADYEQGAGAWVALPVLELDLDNHLVSGLDGELSLYYGLLEGSEDDTTTGSETDTGSTGDETESSTDDGFGPLSHAADLQPIWDAHCVTNCHVAGGLNTDVVLTPDRALDDLLERLPVTATIPFVEPGDPTRSYLLHKLDDRQDEAPGGSGQAMPLGAPLLPVEVRDLVEAWIEQGAPP